MKLPNSTLLQELASLIIQKALGIRNNPKFSHALLESEVNNHVGNQYPALVGRNYERSSGSTIEVKGEEDK